MKIFIFLILSFINLFAFKSVDYFYDIVKNNESQLKYQNNSEIDYSKINLPLKLKKYFNKSECSQVLDKYYYINCYDYNIKGSKYIYTKLNKKIMDSGNIKERPQFYPDEEIPAKYRTYPNDYTRNKDFQDRGHIVSNDSMNHNIKAQNSTFVMSNVVPMLDKVNRGKNSWLGIERYERYVVQKLDEVEVLNIIFYQPNSDRLKNNIAVPSGFGKILFNESKNFEKCFYVPNTNPQNNDIKDLEIDCKKLNWK